MKNAIEKYRQDHGLTYEKLALNVGFSSRGAVFNHCSGQRSISAESAKRYSQALGIPLSELRPDLWPPETAQGEDSHAS